MFRRNKPQQAPEAKNKTVAKSRAADRLHEDDIPPMPQGLEAIADTQAAINANEAVKQAAPARPALPLAKAGVASPFRNAMFSTTGTNAAREQRKLIVGRDIEMSGEVKSCDYAFIEGRVEATIAEAQRLEVATCGLLKGKVTVEEADIAGTFEGDLDVKGRLTIRANGRVMGNITYGDLAVEAGGRLEGQIAFVEAVAEADGNDQASETVVTSPVMPAALRESVA